MVTRFYRGPDPQAEHWGSPCFLLFLRPCLQVPDFFNVTPLSHMHATMTDLTYSLEKTTALKTVK